MENYHFYLLKYGFNYADVKYLADVKRKLIQYSVTQGALTNLEKNIFSHHGIIQSINLYALTD
jgi:hypothetical protein